MSRVSTHPCPGDIVEVPLAEERLVVRVNCLLSTQFSWRCEETGLTGITAFSEDWTPCPE